MLGYSFCKFCNSCRDFNCFTWNNNFNRKEKLAPRVEDATDYYCFVSFHFVTRILRIIRWIIINHDHLINPIHWQLIRIIHSPPVVRANNWSDDRCNDRLRDSQNEIRRNSKSANSEILDIIITANSWIKFSNVIIITIFYPRQWKKMKRSRKFEKRREIDNFIKIAAHPFRSGGGALVNVITGNC